MDAASNNHHTAENNVAEKLTSASQRASAPTQRPTEIHANGATALSALSLKPKPKATRTVSMAAMSNGSVTIQLLLTSNGRAGLCASRACSLLPSRVFFRLASLLPVVGVVGVMALLWGVALLRVEVLPWRSDR